MAINGSITWTLLSAISFYDIDLKPALMHRVNGPLRNGLGHMIHTGHGMNCFEGDDFWHLGIHFSQLFFQMSCVVVAEHGLLGAAGPDAHDHGGVIARVRENVTPYKYQLTTFKWVLNL